MEIYELYSVIISFIETLSETLSKLDPAAKPLFYSYAAFFGTCLGIALCIWLALFLLQSFGIYAMAKKQNAPNRYLAFIPFANTLYMSKLADKCTFFGRRMKNAGIYAMGAQILCFVASAVMIAAQMYLFIGYETCLQPRYEAVGEVTVFTGYSWNAAKTGLPYASFVLYTYSSYIMSIFELAYEVFMLVLVIALFKKYCPKHYFVLSMVALFIPLSRYIIIFVLRNRNPVDYDSYVRKQRADYIRSQQQYYNQFGNPYNNNPYGGNGYNNPYGGYNAQGGNPQNPQNGQNGQNPQGPAPEDPFEEFLSTHTDGNGEN